MKTENFYIPSLRQILGKYRFSPTIKSLEIAENLDNITSAILQELFNEKKIISIKDSPVKDKNGGFMILLKIFFAETKYFKFFFNFSKENKFIGVSMNNFKVIDTNRVSENYFRKLFEIQLNNGQFGIDVEKDFAKNFLPLFKSNTSDCICFQDVSCKPKYDQKGIDFLIQFKTGQIMPLQLKGARDLDGQEYFAGEHIKRYPDIPLIFTFIGEEYCLRKEKLLQLRNEFLAGIRPLVSYIK